MATAFKVSQQVVYPTHGVGKITQIQKRDFNGKPTLYYIIYIEATDMTIMIPVDRARERGIREIVSSEKALAALRSMDDESEVVPTEWKMRYEMNRQHLLKGDVTDIIQVVRTLYHRSKIKELPILERKLYDTAIKLLVDELSISLEKPRDEIEVLVFDRLESEQSQNEEKAVVDVPEIDDFDAGVDEDDLEINKEG